MRKVMLEMLWRAAGSHINKKRSDDALPKRHRSKLLVYRLGAAQRLRDQRPSVGEGHS